MDDPLKIILMTLRAELQQGQPARVAHLKKIQQFRRLRVAHVNREPLVRKGIDAACVYWIDNGKWPMLQDIRDAAYIWERINFAYRSGCLLYSSGFRCAAESRVMVLKFFLILDWDISGRLQAAWRNPQSSD